MKLVIIFGLLLAWSAVIIIAWAVYYVWNEWLATGEDVKRYRNPWDPDDT